MKYAASGFEIAAISEDDEANGVKDFGVNYGAKFPLLWDKDKTIANKWHPPNMPSSFILDKKVLLFSATMADTNSHTKS